MKDTYDPEYIEEIMKKIQVLRKEYEDMFDDYFPNILISAEDELEILEACLESKKDAYEMGFFSLDPNIIY